MNSWRFHHIGFVVRDIDRALEHYQALGFNTSGPDYHLDLPKKAAQIKVRIVPVGDTHLEFLEPHGNETMQSQFLMRHGDGIQHVAFEVDDMEREVRSLLDKGAKLIFNSEIPGRYKYSYFNTGDTGDVRLELIQPLEPTPS